MKQPIIITMGDPTGVGPEIIMKAWLEGSLSTGQRPLVVAGDVAVLQRAATIFGAEVTVEAPDDDGSETLASHRLVCGERSLLLKNLSELPSANLVYGAPDLACGQAMIRYIEWACDRCLSGEAAGMVTAPVNKQALRAAGCKAPGHTELLAARCGVERVVMMLAGCRLRVCLVTTHLPYSEVPKALSPEAILETVQISDAALRRFFGLDRPRLAVLALNPHAGEGGQFGDEEQRSIAPAIEAACQQGIEASGPHSADALFHFAVQGAYDAVICMYHDQGLIPLKLLHFDDGVNVTLGLPIIRTSVDHGTAYDLAGSGRASDKSLLAAVTLAGQMAS